MPAAAERGDRVATCCLAPGPTPTDLTGHALVARPICATSRPVFGPLYPLLPASSAACHLAASSSGAASAGWLWPHFRECRQIPRISAIRELGMRCNAVRRCKSASRVVLDAFVNDRYDSPSFPPMVPGSLLTRHRRIAPIDRANQHPPAGSCPDQRHPQYEASDLARTNTVRTLTATGDIRTVSPTGRLVLHYWVRLSHRPIRPVTLDILGN